jgi:antitoxin component of MazEF toxin-antitoxin module
MSSRNHVTGFVLLIHAQIKLSTIGNSLGVVIEKPILELLNIDRDTELELTTDGDRLIIEPVRERKRRVVAEARKRMAKHDSTFRKLAK